MLRGAIEIYEEALNEVRLFNGVLYHACVYDSRPINMLLSNSSKSCIVSFALEPAVESAIIDDPPKSEHEQNTAEADKRYVCLRNKKIITKWPLSVRQNRSNEIQQEHICPIDYSAQDEQCPVVRQIKMSDIAESKFQVSHQNFQDMMTRIFQNYPNTTNKRFRRRFFENKNYYICSFFYCNPLIDWHENFSIFTIHRDISQIENEMHKEMQKFVSLYENVSKSHYRAQKPHLDRFWPIFKDWQYEQTKQIRKNFFDHVRALQLQDIFGDSDHSITQMVLTFPNVFLDIWELLYTQIRFREITGSIIANTTLNEPLFKDIKNLWKRLPTLNSFIQELRSQRTASDALIALKSIINSDIMSSNVSDHFFDRDDKVSHGSIPFFAPIILYNIYQRLCDSITFSANGRCLNYTITKEEFRNSHQNISDAATEANELLSRAFPSLAAKYM